MLSDTDSDEPWYALSKDKYQTILNRALSEMEEPPVLPPSTVLTNCSELIKLLNQDDGLGMGSAGEPNAAGTTSRGGKSTTIDHKRELDRTRTSSAVVVAEKIPRRSTEIDSVRLRNRINFQEAAKEVWKYSSAGHTNRLAPGKADGGIDCARDVAKHRSIARRANTNVSSAFPRGTGVKLETARCTTESRTLNLSPNQRNSTTSSSQNTDSRYNLRIPNAFNLRPHDNGGKPFPASATKRYTTRSGVTERSVLNDLLIVETKSIPKIDLETPALVPCVSLERNAWSSSCFVFGKSEPVDGATLQVENASLAKEQLLPDESAITGAGRLDNTQKFDLICFPSASGVRNVTENSVSTEFPLFTGSLAGESDVRLRSFDLELHSRRGNDQPRCDLKQGSKIVKAPSFRPSRNPEFEASCLEWNKPRRSPISHETKSQCDKDATPPRVAKLLQFGMRFGEDPKPIYVGHDQVTAIRKTGRNYVPSKSVQQLWTVVDKTVVSSMMEKILEGEMNSIPGRDLREKTTKQCFELERPMSLFETPPAPSKLAALLSSNPNEEPVKHSTDFSDAWQCTHQNMNRRSSFVNGHERLNELVNDYVIGDVTAHGFSGSDHFQLCRSDDVITFVDDDVKSKDDVGKFEATLLDELKLRGGASNIGNVGRATDVKIEPELDAGNDTIAVLHDVMSDVTKVNVSRMSFKWKSNILLRLRKDQISKKKWRSSGTILA